MSATPASISVSLTEAQATELYGALDVALDRLEEARNEAADWAAMMTREEYVEATCDEPRDTVLPHPAHTPDYRTAAEYHADKARAERWNRLWLDD